jgi:GT2 family glycosyltransferase
MTGGCMGTETTTGPDLTLSVVLPTRDRLPFLRGCIASVRDATRAHTTEIVVVDGNSQDGTPEWLDEQPDIRVVAESPEGATFRSGRETWGSFMNRGFAECSGDLVCMLSDDCLIAPNAFDHAVGLMRNRPERCGGLAFAWRDWPYERSFRIGRTFGDRVFVNHGLFRRRMLEEIGFCDATAFAFYHADGDIALRADAAGWIIGAAPACIVEHFAHANITLRKANLRAASNDWSTYSDRWSHLGPPKQNWDRIPLPIGYDASWVHNHWGAQRLSRLRAAMITALPAVSRRFGYSD